MFVRRITGLSIALALALLTCELFSRSYAYLPRTLDPEFGWVATGEGHWHSEGHGNSHWLAHGVRKPTRPARRGSSPILVVGDSFTEAAHVDDGETYTDITARMLQDAGHNVHVLNVGIGGSTLPYYAHLGPAYLRTLDPVWSVVQVNEDDLLSNAFTSLGTRFRRLSDGGLELVVVPPEGRGGLIRKMFRHYRAHSGLLQAALLQYQFLLGQAALFRPFKQSENPVDPPEDNPADYPIREELELLSRAYAGKLTLLFLSRARMAKAGKVSETEKATEEACKLLMLSCVFARHAYHRLAIQGLFPTGHPNGRARAGHLNRIGHRAVAEALAAELVKGRAGAFF